jgi:signal transduction histidine kinase
MGSRPTNERMRSSPTIPPASRVALAVLNLVVVALCVAGFAQLRQKPSIHVDVAERGGRVVVTRLGALASSGPGAPRSGDTILALDTLPIASATGLETLLDARRIGDVARLTLEQTRTVRSVEVTLTRHYSTVYQVIVLLVAALFYGLGVLVLAKRPGDPAAMTFHVAMDAVAVMLLATAGRHAIEPHGLGHVVRVADLLAYALMTVLFFHFTLQFPTPKWEGLRRRIGWVYAAGVLVALVAGAAFLLATLVSERRWLETFASTFGFVQKFFGVLGLASVASFIDSYRRSVERAERIKLRWVLTGVTVGFLSFIAFQLIPQWLHEPPLVAEEWIVLLAGVAPVTFSIAIIRHRVMDLDLLLSRSTVYSIVLATLAITYTGLVFALGAVARAITGTSGDIVPVIATLAIALMFEPVRARAQSFVDRRFFRTRYNLRQAQRQLVEELNACAETGRLAATAIGILDGILAPERIALATVQRDGTVATLHAESGLSDDARQCIAGADIARQLLQLSPGEIHADERWIEPGVEIATNGGDVLRRLGVCCAIASTFDDGQRAVLLLDRKKSGTRYSLEDLDVLRTAITTTGLDLERIMLQTNILRREAEAEHLRELDRIKSYFVSSVTHELKTPLTSIRMFAEMLQGENDLDRARVQRYARIIESESIRLARQIDNVLDFSKIERGTKDYRFETVDLAALVDGVLETVEHQLTSAGFSLERTDDGHELTLVADRDAIAGAIVNLVSNAIKYSGADRSIAVRTYRLDGHAAVAVTDRGIGLSESDRARVFEPFFRAESAKNSGAAGTGLGLALIRHVVEAHGGSVEIESRLGVGSTFTLLLPLSDHHLTSSRHEEHSVDRG